MGVTVEFELRRYGFYPRGGGEAAAHIAPAPHLRPLDLVTRGPRINAFAEAVIAGVGPPVARRELEVLCRAFDLGDANCRLCGQPPDQGPGNVLMLTMEFAHVTEMFTAIGERGKPAEDVARRVVEEAHAYLAAEAVAGEHLADQLLVPFALAGGGSFSMSHLSQHTLTNAEVVQRFLPVTITFTRQDGRTVCTVERRATS
jgi:RNA 3'-terminal phosphate cyclase (ATP)